MEPMSEVRRSFCYSPVLHGVGYDVSHGWIELLAIVEAAHKSLVNSLGQQSSHNVTVENVYAKNFRNRSHSIIHRAFDRLPEAHCLQSFPPRCRLILAGAPVRADSPL